ncbi:MAG: PEGA domain-containing protein [Calditrichota bacterium]
MRSLIIILAAAILALGGYLAYQKWWPTKDGWLVVITDPPGAQIWVDLEPTNYLTGSAPMAIPPGRHSIMVKMDTLESDPVAAAVDIRPSRRDTVRFRLFATEITKPVFKSAPPATTPIEETPPVAEVKPPRETPIIPTGDELRRRAQQDDSLARTQTSKRVAETVADTIPKETPPPPPEKPIATTAKVEVSSSLLEAQIIINDKPRKEVTPATFDLPKGSYTIRVEVPGYKSKPEQSTIRIEPGEPQQFVFFDLIESVPVRTEIHVETSPVPGTIFLDSVQVGKGSVVIPHNYGIYNISFGTVEGYITPQPVHLAVTPDNPTPQVAAVYVRAFHVMAEVNGLNVFATDGDISWTTGVYYEDGGEQPSAALGAKIREITGSQKYGWELAMGDPNRNPTGGDYVQFKFKLPADVSPATPLKLRLYWYRSPRRYPFALSGTSEMVVTVNGRMFLNGYRPTPSVEMADLERYEEWSLGGMLVEGENKITIRAGENNSLYCYLWKVEIQ